jgi:hypothetical protein
MHWKFSAIEVKVVNIHGRLDLRSKKAIIEFCLA